MPFEDGTGPVHANNAYCPRSQGMPRRWGGHVALEEARVVEGNPVPVAVWVILGGVLLLPVLLRAWK